MANIRVARRSGRVFRGGRNVRESQWIGISEVAATLPAANTAVITNSANAALLALRPFTVVRTHIAWHMRSDQTTALEIQHVALGLAVVSDQAVAIGVTAVPTPFTDLGSDLWLLHHILAGTFTFVSGVGFEQPSGTLAQVDSRAMRKVENGQDFVMVLENSGLPDGSANITAGRFLIKLH